MVTAMGMVMVTAIGIVVCVCGCDDLCSAFGAPLQLVWGGAMRECGKLCVM